MNTLEDWYRTDEYRRLRAAAEQEARETPDLWLARNRLTIEREIRTPLWTPRERQNLLDRWRETTHSIRHDMNMQAGLPWWMRIYELARTIRTHLTRTHRTHRRTHQ